MKIATILSGIIFLIALTNCTNSQKDKPSHHVRQVVDTVGFAHLNWQMDSISTRISANFQHRLEAAAPGAGTLWRAAICPHDDYTYASWLYPAVLNNVQAKTLIIFGVAHKARDFKLENRIVFDSFDAWQGPFGEVKVSPLRGQIIHELPENLFVVHDSMQMIEHSVESMLPFLQMQNPATEIVSILVPYMSSTRMDTIASKLATAIKSATTKNNLVWGKDFAILITTDAVHYGNEAWGGKNYAPYGCDSAGYKQAVAHEQEIIQNCFTGDLNKEKANRFYDYTVQASDYHEYKWTWCGRYSVPLGLKTAWQLQQLNHARPLSGHPLGYETSISQQHLPVDDLNMGRTAIATAHHWVGYASVGFD